MMADKIFKKIEMPDGTVYDLGGSGGASINYQDGKLIIDNDGSSDVPFDTGTLLYENSTLQNTITLSDSYKNYDYIYIFGGYTLNSIGHVTHNAIYKTVDLNNGDWIGLNNEAYTRWYQIQDEKTFIMKEGSYIIFEKIYGLKTSSNSSKSIHKYSTEEKVVGEWIDGKPIYEITIDLGGITGTQLNNYDLSYLNIDKVINMDCNYRQTNSGQWQTTMSLTSGFDSRYFYYDISNKCLINGGTHAAFIFDYVFIQYTKTTD